MKPFTQRITRLFNLFVVLIVALVGALLILMFKIKTTPPLGCATTDQETYSAGCIPPTPTPSFTSDEQALYTHGKTLFSNNCEPCHSPGGDIIVGPGLKGILERRSVDWLIPWVQNSQKVILSSKPYALKVHKPYGQLAKHQFQLTSNQVKSILFYVANYGSSEVVHIDSLENKKD
jgi:mono/diheme cytochrome c family protein